MDAKARRIAMQAQQNNSFQKPTRITLDNAGLEALGKNIAVNFRPIWNVEKKYLCGYMIRPSNRQHATPDLARRGLFP